MNVTFVSTNPGKFREVRAILSEFDVTVRWSRRELPEVQADGLDPVVQTKLSGTRDLRGYVLVEDSGLFLSGLGGFPGVYSAFVYESIGLPGVLKLLRGRPRRARFCTVAGLRCGRRRWLFHGESMGRIAHRPRGRNGFGYDPIFIPGEGRRTFAELTSREKNEVSHRARALRRVGAFLSGA